LDHPWLKMAPEYDVRISDEEYQAKIQKQNLKKMAMSEKKEVP